MSVVSGKGRLNMLIYDDVLDKYLRCNIPENLLSDILSAYRKRLSVSGLIHCYKNGEIKEIELEDFEVFPTEKHSCFEDLFGVSRGVE